MQHPVHPLKEKPIELLRLPPERKCGATWNNTKRSICLTLQSLITWVHYGNILGAKSLRKNWDFHQIFSWSRIQAVFEFWTHQQTWKFPKMVALFLENWDFFRLKLARWRERLRESSAICSENRWFWQKGVGIRTPFLRQNNMTNFMISCNIFYLFLHFANE